MRKTKKYTRNKLPACKKKHIHIHKKIYTMSTNTTDQEYFKQETVSMWPSPSTPSDISSSSASPDHDYNVYHVPRGFDVVLVPLKVEEQTYPDSVCSESSIESPLDSTSSSTTKPVDIPKSKTPSSTDAKVSSSAITNTTTTTRLSAYRKRKADKNYIPRPKNCFMAYREHIKEKFLSENPGMNNKVVSVLAANMWNNEPENVKEIWRERAKQLKAEHKLKYPDYKFKPQKKKQNLKTPGSTKTSSKTNNARNNNKKSNSDSKIIFADSGYGSEILGDSDDGKHIYHHPIGLEDSVSSWTSDSTASTPLLSPFARSPASLSPPTFQFGSQFGRSSSALRYEAAHNEDSQPTSTDYDLMAMGHFTTSPTEEQGGFFHDYDNTESAYHNHVYNSSFELSSQEGQSSLAEHYALVLETPRRNSQQLLADFQHGLKQQEMLLQGL
ncbi:hmg box protein [Rhizophagus clarus]|uniref:Hmg box protein n=1 Tax=Rhizophagus clarus TaxID=94130 RepID=A0A8H3QHQ6_9GLOM|nr:hmg box protein [Rhizophagus clarus]